MTQFEKLVNQTNHKLTSVVRGVVEDMGCSIEENSAYGDYGHSDYIYVTNPSLSFEERCNNTVKIRISDHEIQNPVRVATEICFYSNAQYAEQDLIKKYKEIEVRVFPERFTRVETVRNFSKTMEVPAHDIKENDTVISERVSNTGTTVFTISRPYSKIIVSYEKP